MASFAILALVESCSAPKMISSDSNSELKTAQEAVSSDSNTSQPIEPSDFVKLEDISIELDETTGLSLIVFKGILVATTEVPRVFGSPAQHSVTETSFNPKKLKDTIVDGVHWTLIEMNGKMYWVSNKP